MEQPETRPRSSSFDRRPSTPTHVELPESGQPAGEALKQHMRDLLAKTPPGSARHESIRKWLERAEEQSVHLSISIENELEAEALAADRPTTPVGTIARRNANYRHSAPVHRIMQDGLRQDSSMLLHMRAALLKEPHDSPRRSALAKWLERAEAQQAELSHSIELETAEAEGAVAAAAAGPVTPRPTSASQTARKRTSDPGSEQHTSSLSKQHVAPQATVNGLDLLASLLRFKFGRFRKQLSQRRAMAQHPSAANAGDVLPLMREKRSVDFAGHARPLMAVHA